MGSRDPVEYVLDHNEIEDKREKRERLEQNKLADPVFGPVQPKISGDEVYDPLGPHDFRPASGDGK